mmetsp:Transcript_19248/g.49271  ORF Transcript_19248/g.49271 Transcript_19248/m.49271 type:complete len:161 (+) Transcript_19248:4555-5037(+)
MWQSAVIAGELSSASARNSAIIGGARNVLAEFAASSIAAGGSDNTITGSNSATLGGARNTIGGDFSAAGGELNIVTGSHSFAFGYGASAMGNNTVAMGRGAQAMHSGAIVIADGSATNISSTEENEITFHASNGLRVLTNDIGTTGVYVPAGSGAWATLR